MFLQLTIIGSRLACVRRVMDARWRLLSTRAARVGWHLITYGEVELNENRVFRGL